MASTTLYCSNAKVWESYWNGSEQVEDWDESFPSVYGHTSYDAVPIGSIPFDSGSRYGMGIFVFPALPAGAVISAATIHLKTSVYTGSTNATVYFRVADSDELQITAFGDADSQYLSFPSTLYNVSFDLTTQMQDHSVSGSPVYVYFYRTDEAVYEDFAQIDSSTPYIEVTYTVPVGSTIGLYNGSTFTDRIIKKRVSGAWVQCDCYKYVSGAWVKVSTT
jgi:hypothetical protein